MASRARAWLLLWALCALPAVESVILVNVASPLSKELRGVAVVWVSWKYCARGALNWNVFEVCVFFPFCNRSVAERRVPILSNHEVGGSTPFVRFVFLTFARTPEGERRSESEN